MKVERILFGIGLLTFCICSGLLMGQEGEAGVESPFSIGVGARALGLGSAAVAFPDDPSAFTWNPAGMVVVQQREIGLSLTTLFEGTQYNFIGYVHPTMTTGTFGMGIARIGTGGIKYTEERRGIPLEIGELSYWWGKLILSYAMTLLKGLSVGINFDMNRQVLGFYSTNGFGVDLGLHYGFPQEGGILKNLYLGCYMINVLSPRLKLGIQSETVPYNVRGGMAKVFTFRQDTDRWLILADLEQGEHKPLRYHVGMEYGWNNAVFLRTGLDNGEVTFGGGLRYYNFQLDYGTSRIGDPEFFPRSHRFSLVFYFGKSISEKKRLLEEQRREEIQRRIDERLEASRQRQITEGLQAGREYLEKGDYFSARLEFSRVLSEDRENRVAQELLDSTTVGEQEFQRRWEEELIEQDRERERQQRDNTFVNQRLIEGNEALGNGDFHKAIEKWQEALERDPENPLINNNIRKAKVELENEVNKLIARAKQLERRENLSEAYKVLGQAKDQTVGNPELQARVLREIQSLDRIVDFITNYQEGEQQYGKGDYEGAARSLRRALEYNPSHGRAKELYRNSLARSEGKKEEMTGEVRKKHNEGVKLYQEGSYEDALKVWEEALNLDPHNVYILNAIEMAKKKLELYKKKE